MTLLLNSALEGLLQAYRRKQNLSLLFDYDGTLTPIVEHPDLARLDEKTACLLERLANRPRIGVGIISGRMLAELRELAPIPNVQLAGISGLEMELNGLLVHHPCCQEGVHLMSEVACKLRKSIDKFPGAWLENKKLGLTVHYRSVDGELHAFLQTSVHDRLYSYRHRINVTEGPMSIEITPKLGWTKNTSVRIMAQSMGASGKGVLYAGDGANDIDAFAAVASMGGIAVGVGLLPANLVDCCLPDTDALYDLIAEFEEELDSEIYN